MPRTTARGVAVLVMVLSSAGCSEEAPEASVDDVLSQLARDSGLPVVDLSVPLDRFNQAPGALEQLAANLVERVPGIYVMRYYDDTLRSTAHIFDCRREGIRYLTVTSIAAGPFVHEETVISEVAFDASTSTLTLTWDAGSVQLTPQDVTPVGA